MKAFACTLLVSLVASAAAAEIMQKDVDLEGADGAKLKATYTSPGKKGPGMLLIHQCNMNRQAWTDLTAELAAAGVHVLTMDLRGFGDSEGEPLDSREAFQGLMQKSPDDLDRGLAYLVSQKGVDRSRLGVGGASCGAMLTADLAARNPDVGTLMLLSGPPSEKAVAHMAETPGLAVFVAATKGDTITPGVADALEKAATGSANKGSVAKIFEGTEHGMPMFEKNPELGPELVAWLKARLLE